MRLVISIPLLPILITCIVIAAEAARAEVPEAAGNKPVITLGAGAVFAPDYIGSDDYEPLPLWSLQVGNLFQPDTLARIVGNVPRHTGSPGRRAAA